MHKLKHAEKAGSVTYNGHPVPVTDFSYADTRDHYQAKEIRRMRLACSDTADSPALFGKSRAHIIAADLPYGIQHAPQSGKQADSLPAFLHRVLPVWKRTLEPHGVIALSFNTLTLPSSDVRSALLHAGFSLPKNDIFFHLRHDVEQAVVRDVIFAFNTEEESVI